MKRKHPKDLRLKVVVSERAASWTRVIESLKASIEEHEVSLQLDNNALAFAEKQLKAEEERCK